MKLEGKREMKFNYGLTEECKQKILNGTETTLVASHPEKNNIDIFVNESALNP